MKTLRVFPCRISNRALIFVLAGLLLGSCIFVKTQDRKIVRRSPTPVPETGYVVSSRAEIPLPDITEERFGRTLCVLNDDEILYCAVISSDSTHTLSFYRTEDGGRTWVGAGQIVCPLFPQIKFETVGRKVYCCVWFSSFKTSPIVSQSTLYVSEDKGDTWSSIWTSDVTVASMDRMGDGVVIGVFNVFPGQSVKLLHVDNKGSVSECPFVPDSLSRFNYSVCDDRLLFKHRDTISGYGLISEKRSALYLASDRPFSPDGKRLKEILWCFLSRENHVILHEGYVVKSLALQGDSLQFRSLVKSPNANVYSPAHFYSQGDTLFVCLENLSYNLRRRTLASVDGGWHWTDLYEGDFTCAYGASLYSLAWDDDRRDHLYKTTVHPLE